MRFLDGLLFAEAVETLGGENVERPQIRTQERVADPDEYERRQATKAQWLWLQRRPIASSPAERYLREVRRYTGLLPATLGFLPPSKPAHHPAMIAAFSLVDELDPGVVGEPRDVSAVHLTLLQPDGSGKAEVSPNKLIIGRPLNRPIVLAPPDDLLGMAIAEGIEDALSVHEAIGLGAWAAGSAGFMPALADAVPSYVEVVHVLVDDDHAGRNYAGELVRYLRAREFEVIPRLLQAAEAA